MTMRSRRLTAPLFGVLIGTVFATARGETLEDAWSIALTVNQQLQSQRTQAEATDLNVDAARRERMPSVTSYNINVGITSAPKIRATIPSGAFASSAAPAKAAVGGNAVAPNLFSALGNQTDIPISLTTAAVPIYTGGRIQADIDAAKFQAHGQQTEIARTALDLKLTVAEAYVGVLRGRRNLEVAASNVSRLSSFARDVRNRREQGLAIKSDELASEVSLANAQLSEIQARTTLESAWATYNRYLCRPFTVVVALQELAIHPPDADWKQLAVRALRAHAEFAALKDAEIEHLTAQALNGRPELAGLADQARVYGAQARSTMAAIKPQVGFNGGFLYAGVDNFVPQGFGVAAVYVDWTITDGGVSRRRAASLRRQECSTLQRRADTAAAIALEVRTRWLDLQQARQSVPVARFAIAQAEENINVVTDRYRQSLATYTEVLDAENRRIQSYFNYYNAVYDESLALFRLRRSVGDL